jgi:hypothetical protein
LMIRRRISRPNIPEEVSKNISRLYKDASSIGSFRKLIQEEEKMF